MAIETDVDAAVAVVRICERCARVGRVLVMVLVRGSRGGVRARRCVAVRRRLCARAETHQLELAGLLTESLCICVISVCSEGLPFEFHADSEGEES